MSYVELEFVKLLKQLNLVSLKPQSWPPVSHHSQHLSIGQTFLLSVGWDGGVEVPANEVDLP